MATSHDTLLDRRRDRRIRLAGQVCLQARGLRSSQIGDLVDVSAGGVRIVSEAAGDLPVGAEVVVELSLDAHQDPGGPTKIHLHGRGVVVRVGEDAEQRAQYGVALSFAVPLELQPEFGAPEVF
jgi:hypothetical protein